MSKPRMPSFGIMLRLATLDDARRLFDWRNDEITRQNSIQTKPVPWEDHVAWLERVVGGKSPGRTLYIAEVAGEAVGMARLDRDVDDAGKKHVEISYSVAPEARGKGYGKAIALECKNAYIASDEEISATIKKGHEPSERIAQALGLHPVSEKASENPDDARPVVEWRS